MQRKITDYFLYRRRYLIGYIVMAGVMLAGLFAAWLYVPGGITEAEMASSVKSGSLSIKDFEPSMVIDAPYHLLQRAAFRLFGVSILMIKLPSLILGILTAIGLYMLLQNWFQNNVAIPTTLVAITSPQFIFLAQNGTPTVLFACLSIWLILFATFAIWRRSPTIVWKLCLFLTAGLALYMPLGVYLIAALATTFLFHPHVRHSVLSLSRLRMLLGLLVILVVTAPLIYALVLEPTIGLTLLGIPTHAVDIFTNLKLLFNLWFNFWSPARGELITPVYSLAIGLLMLLGVYRLIHVRYTARSYLTWAWMILLTPLIVVNPSLQYAFFLIMVLLLARGISQLLVNWWYRLFPRNPYARIAGMIPVALVIVGIVASSVYRYMYSTFYSPDIARSFSRDLTLLQKELSTYSQGNAKALVVVSDDELPFYTLASKYHNKFIAMDHFDAQTTTASTVIVSRNADKKDISKLELKKIITGYTYESADRFYTYTIGKK